MDVTVRFETSCANCAMYRYALDESLDKILTPALQHPLQFLWVLVVDGIVPPSNKLVNGTIPSSNTLWYGTVLSTKCCLILNRKII